MGERDIDEFQAIANHITRTIPRITKLVLPGVGHMSNMEAPDEFNEAVLSSLGKLDVSCLISHRVGEYGKKFLS